MVAHQNCKAACSNNEAGVPRAGLAPGRARGEGPRFDGGGVARTLDAILSLFCLAKGDADLNASSALHFH